MGVGGDKVWEGGVDIEEEEEEDIALLDRMG